MAQYKQMLLCLDLEARHREAFCELLHTCPDVRHLGTGGEAGGEVLEHAPMASLHLLAQLQNLQRPSEQEGGRVMGSWLACTSLHSSRTCDIRQQRVWFIVCHSEACGPLFREVITSLSCVLLWPDRMQPVPPCCMSHLMEERGNRDEVSLE